MRRSSRFLPWSLLAAAMVAFVHPRDARAGERAIGQPRYIPVESEHLPPAMSSPGAGGNAFETLRRLRALNARMHGVELESESPLRRTSVIEVPDTLWSAPAAPRATTRTFAPIIGGSAGIRRLRACRFTFHVPAFIHGS
jgi:hypothetical protein